MSSHNVRSMGCLSSRRAGTRGSSAGVFPSAEIVLSLGRLNRIREIDPVNATITAEAGCTLQSVQQAAAAVDRFFPLSLASEGSCQIGGNLSTNAGGTAVATLRQCS